MRFALRFSLVGVVVLAPVTAAWAQKNTKPAPPPAAPAAPAAKAEISGLVLDSLNGRFLSGADIIIQGAKVTAVTDSLGRFKVGNLAPGTYQVGVFHPLLDTLGIALATRPFYLGADSASFIVLAVPSATSIIRTACPVRGFRPQGTSAVIGHVLDPETLLPVAGAEASIAWVQLEVSKEFGVRRTPRVIRDSTDSMGAFSLCGLPNAMQATLQARKANAVTAEIPITVADQESALFARTMLLSKADSGTKTGTATVSGRVVLEGAPSNAGSRVEVVGTDVVALTNENGEFSMRNLPSGSHVLLARHLGFGAETIPVDLSTREPKRVTLKLPKFVAVLDPVLVTSRRVAGLDKIGFNKRKQSGTGFYLGPEQIQKLHPNSLTDILRTIPGLRVNYGPQGEEVSSSRGVTSLQGGSGCVQYYVDDSPWQSMSPGDVNNFVNGNEVVGVEVYSGPGTPPQYQRGDCTTIVLWTKFKIRD